MTAAAIRAALVAAGVTVEPGSLARAREVYRRAVKWARERRFDNSREV